MTIAFATNALELFGGGLILDAIFLLIQTYGLLFIALTYARRTRLKFVGESVSIELAIPSVVTALALGYVFVYENPSSLGAVPFGMNLTLRTVMVLAALYLVYETARNWTLTRRSDQGFVTIGYSLLLIEQLGFLLQAEQFGDVAMLLGYEGRIAGLFVLLAITHLAIGKSDATILRRMGLTALAH
jgi:hypothetical protein